MIGDPVRRRLLELLAEGERSAGELVAEIVREFGISQPAVSQHLKILRKQGFADVTPEGTRRLYSLELRRFAELDAWLAQFPERA